MIRRFILFLAALLVVCVGSARADDLSRVVQGTTTSVSGFYCIGLSPESLSPTQGQACNSCSTRHAPSPSHGYATYSSVWNGSSCTTNIYYSNGNWAGSIQEGIASGSVNQYTCPSNSVKEGGTCYCSEGYKASDDKTSCVPNPCMQKVGQPVGGQGEEFQTRVLAYESPTVMCNDGCRATGSSEGLFSRLGDKIYFNGFNAGAFTFDGTSCTPGASGQVEPLPTPCPSGKVPGQINGMDVCVGASSTTSRNTETTVTKNPDGSVKDTSTTQIDATCDRNGNCSVNKTKLNPDGTTSTSSSKTTANPNAPGGTEGGTGGGGLSKNQAIDAGKEGTKEGLAEFCAENPQRPICKVSTFTGSACGSAPSCDGDAVLCAMAAEQHRRNCQLMEPDGYSVELEGLRNSDPTGNPADNPEERDMAAGLSQLMDATPLFGSASACPVDVPVTVQGYSMVIPFSKMCVWLRMLGGLLMAATYVSAAYIVFRK